MLEFIKEKKEEKNRQKELKREAHKKKNEERKKRQQEERKKFREGINVDSTEVVNEPTDDELHGKSNSKGKQGGGKKNDKQQQQHDKKEPLHTRVFYANKDQQPRDQTQPAKETHSKKTFEGNNH